MVEVDPERLDRWFAGFAQGSALEGAVAEVLPWSQGRADLPERLGLILLRRGGYAVGLAQGDRLTDHYCGTRYVQSRTAAGGWSQQRFARRRGNQADALVERVIEQAADRLLTPQGPQADALVVGGDKALIRQVLADPVLARLADLPRREFNDIPDPRLKVLQEALRRGRASRIRIIEPV